MISTSDENISNIPLHVAIIMDGNGRWAVNRGLERTEGHVRGVDSVREITAAASTAGVKYLTLYAFSTENWHRPDAEVNALMNLLAMSIEAETPSLIANNVRISIIGDLQRLPEYAYESLMRSVELSSECDGLNLILAISYSARWEITEAARRIARLAMDGEIDIDAIDDDMLSDNLSTAGIPDPDLLIRTGGDFRVSNFLLWQIAYAEIYVTKVLWPDFGKDQFMEALADYSRRQRRFGMTGEQVSQQSDNHNQ
ncbi:MAG: isoprenyl transferase [Muribaculum sp.]|nr:isoprenyl transferase [Muribaculum sp.]